MTEKEFKDQFQVTFLATWAANKYLEPGYIFDGWAPVEDAECLAQQAWDKQVEIIGDFDD